MLTIDSGLETYRQADRKGSWTFEIILKFMNSHSRYPKITH
jgi:hypothetical protein